MQERGRDGSLFEAFDLVELMGKSCSEVTLGCMPHVEYMIL